jgi:hypothetical protein
MGKIQVITANPAQIGALGLTIGRAPDPGGGNAQDAITVPLVAVNWFDERQTCRVVLAFVHDSLPPDLVACPSYRAGECSRMGSGTPCAFHEPDTADVWGKAAEWRHVPNVGVIHRQLWPEFGIAT